MSEQRRFGTFEAVFLPTLLTILGVILYLRSGWVVGHAGLGGAWLVIGATFSITGATAASIVHAVRVGGIGSGGAFGLFERTVGPAIAGSIGLPLFVTQALVVALYVFGFRAGWLRVFPDHPPLAVDLATLAVLLGVAYASARLAFRIQFLILLLIGASLASVLAAVFLADETFAPTWWVPGEGESLSAVFAVFFPAATGILAGANLSGELEDPAHAIPRGTLAAIGVSVVVYLAVAAFLATHAPVEALRSDERVLIDRAAFGPAVLAGLLGATFSSGLASSVGAPRILRAMAESRVLPGAAWLEAVDGRGEPRHAILVTGVVVLAGIALRELDVIAKLLTVIFLVTYGAINAVVLLHRTPKSWLLRAMSAFGALGCGAAMLLVSIPWSAAALLCVAASYFGLRAFSRTKVE